MPVPPQRPRRLAYLGSPSIAVPPLRALVAAGHEVALVVTGEPKRRGRGQALSSTPVGAAAHELGLAVCHDPTDLQSAGCDLGVVVAYGRLLRAPVLAALALVNLHFSLLPRWRGAAPVERALLAGDVETGVCLMEVAPELDAGGVFRRGTTPITPRDTAETLRVRLVDQGISLLLDALESGFGTAEPQRGPSSYAAKLTRDDVQLRWGEEATVLDRVVRVGGAWTTVSGSELKVWRARPVPDQVGERRVPPGTLEVHRRRPPIVHCGAGALELGEVQAAGRARVDAAAWAHGVHPPLLLGT